MSEHTPDCARRFVGAAECTCPAADSARYQDGITPGPWTVDTAGWPLIINARGPEHVIVTTLDLPEGSSGDDYAGLQAVANARAIAAVPELICALQWTLDHLHPLAIPSRNAAMARALFARIEGR